MTLEAEVDPGPSFFDSYRLVKLIGSGAMGRVFEAAKVADGSPVAVKFLTHAAGDGPARFARELDVLRRIDHPNVVRVLDGALHRGSPWLVLEYVAGGTLADLIKREGKLAPEVAVGIISDVLTGLTACHQQHVLHRDLKPSNVLLTAEGRAKLSDFGVARDQASDANLTATGFVMGTPLYMAPEVLVDGEAWTARGDVYGAGALLYEMLAGVGPVTGADVSEICAQHAVKRRSVASRAEGLPPELVAIVDRAVARQAAQRPASAGELLVELHRALPGVGVALNLPAPVAVSRDVAATHVGARADLVDPSRNVEGRPEEKPAPRPLQKNEARVESRKVPAGASRSLVRYQPVELQETPWIMAPPAVFAPLIAAIALAAPEPAIAVFCASALALVGAAIKEPVLRVVRREAALVIDDDGFEDRRLGLGRIAWTDVRDVKLIPGAKGHHLIKVSLSDPDRLGNMTLYGALTSHIEREPRKARLFLGVGALRVTASQLYQLLDERWRAARQ